MITFFKNTISKNKIFILFIFLILFGCSTKTESPVYVVNGKSYGVIDGVFRNRFWHYYERGVSYSEGGFFKEALADFDQAIALRSEDQRRARTYGMHFVDYFPNREKGIALLEMERLEEAKQSLEKSLSQFPSSKANFYLDRIRERFLKSSKSAKSYPQIVLTAPVNNIALNGVDIDAGRPGEVPVNSMVSNEVWTKDDPVVLRGEINDTGYVSEIFINDSKVFQEHASQNIKLNQSITLEQGQHKLNIRAKNLMGLESSKSINLHVDREGPMLVVESITDNPTGNEILISAALHDEAGIAKFGVRKENGGEKIIPYELSNEAEPYKTQSYKKHKNKSHNFQENQKQTEQHFKVKLPNNTGQIVVTASDLLDNQTIAKISIKPQNIIRKRKNISWLNSRGILVADAGSLMNTGTLADAGSVKGLVKGLFDNEPEDKSPPVLSIPDWEEPQTVYLEKVYLDGEVTDDHQIKSITINGVEKLKSNEISPAHLFFNHLVRLKPGENKIAVSAADKSGNTVNRELTIIRKIADVFQIDKRLSLSVLPFESKGEVPESALGFQDNIIDGLVEQNRFNMVERAKLDAILAEQKLTQEAVFDQSNAIKIGKLMAARSILTGTIVATRKGLEIAARMVDTETSEILASKDVYGESMELPAIRELAQGLAVKFHQDFPLVSGIVVQNKGGALMLDLGQSVLKPNRRVIVFREEPVVHPVTGKSLGMDNTILGYAQVNQVMTDISKATMVSADNPAKALDKVITE